MIRGLVPINSVITSPCVGIYATPAPFRTRQFCAELKASLLTAAREATTVGRYHPLPTPFRAHRGAFMAKESHGWGSHLAMSFYGIQEVHSMTQSQTHIEADEAGGCNQR